VNIGFVYIDVFLIPSFMPIVKCMVSYKSILVSIEMLSILLLGLMNDVLRIISFTLTIVN
jgi:hypothetical protein